MEIFLVLASAVGGAYFVYRVLAAAVGFVARLAGVPEKALFYLGLLLMGSALASVALTAMADSCGADVTLPLLSATAALTLAPALARNITEKRARRLVQAPSLLGLLTVPVFSVVALGDREAAASRSMTIGDLRTLVSAEMAYASMNGELFDRPECLQRPSECIPGFGADAPVFLDRELAAAARLGYARRFHPGPGATEEEIRTKNASASSLKAFAFTAVPAPRTRGRCESFCTDSTGRICFLSDGSEPPVVDGLCSPACPSLGE
jgi:hypothetical protein